MLLQHGHICTPQNCPLCCYDDQLSFQRLSLILVRNGFQETDEKMHQRPRPQADKLPRRRQALPPWLQTVNWTPELRLMYRMPMVKAKNVLKKDRESLKKLVQLEHTKAHLETLLEEVESPDYVSAMVSWKKW